MECDCSTALVDLVRTKRAPVIFSTVNHKAAFGNNFPAKKQLRNQFRRGYTQGSQDEGKVGHFRGLAPGVCRVAIGDACDAPGCPRVSLPDCQATGRQQLRKTEAERPKGSCLFPAWATSTCAAPASDPRQEDQRRAECDCSFEKLFAEPVCFCSFASVARWTRWPKSLPRTPLAVTLSQSSDSDRVPHSGCRCNCTVGWTSNTTRMCRRTTALKSLTKLQVWVSPHPCRGDPMD